MACGRRTANLHLAQVPTKLVTGLVATRLPHRRARPAPSHNAFLLTLASLVSAERNMVILSLGKARLFGLICVSVCVLLSSSSVALADLPTFFATHCFRCHGAESQEGDFRLDSATTRAEDAEFGTVWSRVLERVNSGEMPPADEPQPTADERYAAAEWISHGLQAWDAARNASQESVSFKRLTRSEYVHTLYDLLGFTYHPSDPGGLPEDPSWHGMERTGTVLTLTPSHIERYVAAAELALHEVMPLSVAPPPWRWDWTAPDLIHLRNKHQQPDTKTDPAKHRLVIGPANNWKHYVGGLNQVTLPRAGHYRIRVMGSGLRPPGGSAPHVVLYDATIDRTLLEADLDAAEDQPALLQSEVWLPGGTHDLILRNELPGPSPYDPHARGGNADVFTTLKNGRSPFLQKLSDNDFRPYVPLLILDAVSIEAIVDPWPPAAQTRIFTPGPHDAMHAESILTGFAERAFRRPVTRSEMQRYLAVTTTAQGTGATFEEGIREAMLAILCAPDFLFLVEGSPEEQRRQLNDFELASRLSYFLWSTMPDDELMDVARTGQLHRREVLERQVDRLLADPRSTRFAHEFARQWLQLNDVGKFPPDKKLYPSYDAGLQRSMIAESQEFFNRVLRDNRSIREFLDSDWTMLNHRMAEHYQIEGVTDFDMRAVSLPKESHRGGLLTQASVLTLTSDGFRQRPVHRGRWVSEVILGVSPPPPPPNAGSIPTPTADEPKKTIREKLEAHRENASCAACHARIDPLGFAFENYNAIGLWRTVEESSVGTGPAPTVDASGALHDGRQFAGPEEFKQLLVAETNRFANVVTKSMATYALRRGMTFSDRRAIERIVDKARPDEYPLRDLVRELVLSDLFQMR